MMGQTFEDFIEQRKRRMEASSSVWQQDRQQRDRDFNVRQQSTDVIKRRSDKQYGNSIDAGISPGLSRTPVIGFNMTGGANVAEVVEARQGKGMFGINEAMTAFKEGTMGEYNDRQRAHEDKMTRKYSAWN